MFTPCGTSRSPAAVVRGNDDADRRASADSEINRDQDVQRYGAPGRHIHREREYLDRLTMLEQLGVVPLSNETMNHDWARVVVRVIRN